LLVLLQVVLSAAVGSVVHWLAFSCVRKFSRLQECCACWCCVFACHGVLPATGSCTHHPGRCCSPKRWPASLAAYHAALPHMMLQLSQFAANSKQQAASGALLRLSQGAAVAATDVAQYVLWQMRLL
jgi:hypothetical protein